jgi:pimeloyl-ACP methyl ester carboxylesterase
MEPQIETQFVQTRGLRFEVATAGSGDKLALLLHGFPESAYSWRYQIPLLARLGYRVWAPNLRGYGKSERPVGLSHYMLDKLEQDVADLIDASGAKSVLLVGHDWGGGIAWAFALFGQRPIERLVVMNTPHPACFREGLRTLRQLRRSWYFFFLQIPGLPEWLLSLRDHALIAYMFRSMAIDKSRFPDEVLREYRQNAAEPGALKAMVDYYRAMLRTPRALTQRAMPVIEVPVLMLWGERDSALGKELTYGTGRHVRDLTLRYLPRVSHWVQQEAPEQVNAMLEAWLTGRPVPEAT